MNWLQQYWQKLTGTIDLRTAEKFMKQGASLIDVRSDAEFHSDHASLSINFPLDKISSQSNKLPKTPLILHCHSGIRSGIAVAQLKKQGYQAIYNLGGLGKAKQLCKRLSQQR